MVASPLGRDEGRKKVLSPFHPSSRFSESLLGLGDRLPVGPIGKQAEDGPGVEFFTGRTLPSANTNWQTPGCQLPNWVFAATVGLMASGHDAPARRW